MGLKQSPGSVLSHLTLLGPAQGFGPYPSTFWKHLNQE